MSAAFSNEYDLSQLTEMAGIVKKHLLQKRIALFVGEVGAGKTTLIKEVCHQLGVEDEVSSPTYSLVNEYRSDEGTIYHMDLYRLNSALEMYEAGIIEYLESGSICLVEWPDLVLPVVENMTYIKVELHHLHEKRLMMLTIQ
jgi:tRNA threonylcarbamoyladenosine biosynthesis protein TsaE